MDEKLARLIRLDGCKTRNMSFCDLSLFMGYLTGIFGVAMFTLCPNIFGKILYASIGFIGTLFLLGKANKALVKGKQIRKIIDEEYGEIKELKLLFRPSYSITFFEHFFRSLSKQGVVPLMDLRRMRPDNAFTVDRRTRAGYLKRSFHVKWSTKP